jgi:hypothetical protein
MVASTGFHLAGQMAYSLVDLKEAQMDMWMA